MSRTKTGDGGGGWGGGWSRGMVFMTDPLVPVCILNGHQLMPAMLVLLVMNGVY